MAGLGTGFGVLGQALIQQSMKEDDEKRVMRKMQLANKLSMDLMKAKIEFYRQNPQYSQHFTDLSGNIYGIDKMSGNVKQLHAATPEEQKINLGKSQSVIDKNDAESTAALAKVDPDSPMNKSLIDYRKAIGERARAGKPVKADKDPLGLDPLHYDAAIKKLMPKDIADAGPDDPDYEKEHSKAEQFLKENNYYQIKPGMTGKTTTGAGGGNPEGQGGAGSFGPFGGLVPQAASDGADSEDDEDSDDQNILGL
jgi:hypothetical protein